MENLIRTEKVNAIVAWNDRDYELIFALQQFLDETGVVVLGPSKACFDVVYNKKTCSDFLLQNQFLVPSTFSEESAVFPLVLKPEKGSGSVDVYTIRDRQELDAYIRKIRHPFLQESIDGTHYTVDMFNTAYRNPAAAIPRKRLKVHGSESLVGQICMHADIIDLCLRIGRILDVVGAFNIQLIERDGSYYVHDINLRVSGSCDLTIAAGAPLQAWLVDYAMGKRSSFDVRIKDKMIMSKYYEPCFF
ncbi:ATP-grasp domain-containing protein [Flavobacterium sp. MAH-1]|uniref:ATP-grasp domain-containing protein n=1 Tax=Flavobacterium agri TaxID=2743471 RepID=UPI00158BEF20|nr:ATP-grasp domain-containing protein [Flavobacterium agri]NUY80470.1 ATP-grasp domain-containing protein [Flavobacterium agri]